jgi:predicted metal-binding membrane protein
MAVLLVIGVMDLRAMAVVAAAITIERLLPAASVSREPPESSASGPD